jgi:hypothetical protein
MKKIDQYLHLYIGCEVLAYCEQQAEKCKGYLTGIHGEYGPEVQFIIGNHAEEEPEYPGAENTKLVLRRLSSMTEEEKIKLYGMGFTHNSRGLQIEHPKKWPTFKPVQFQYLLSIGIDLFGLIDSGLAIDAAHFKPRI